MPFEVIKIKMEFRRKGKVQKKNSTLVITLNLTTRKRQENPQAYEKVKVSPKTENASDQAIRECS